MIAGDVPIPLHYIAFPLHPHYSPSIFPFYSIPRLNNQMVFPFFLVHSGKKSLPSGWWFGTVFIFHILGIIIPTDELIFFRGVGIPPTSHSIYIPWAIDPSQCSPPCPPVGFEDGEDEISLDDLQDAESQGQAWTSPGWAYHLSIYLEITMDISAHTRIYI